MKSSNIGGQAVIEGVMMKNKDRYAVAVRKPDGEIEVTTDTYKSVVGKYTALTKLPFVRGIFNFVDSLVLGMKTLTWSASFYEEEEEKEMTGNVWMFSDEIDDEDLEFMSHDYVTYNMACEYYRLGMKPVIRMAHEAGAVYKIGKKVLIRRSIFEAYLREQRKI